MLHIINALAVLWCCQETSQSTQSILLYLNTKHAQLRVTSHAYFKWVWQISNKRRQETKSINVTSITKLLLKHYAHFLDSRQRFMLEHHVTELLVHVNSSVDAQLLHISTTIRVCTLLLADHLILSNHYGPAMVRSSVRMTSVMNGVSHRRLSILIRAPLICAHAALARMCVEMSIPPKFPAFNQWDLKGKTCVAKSQSKPHTEIKGDRAVLNITSHASWSGVFNSCSEGELGLDSWQ